MNTTLLKDSAIYGVGILLTRALGFLLIPLYTRYLSVPEYGVLSLLVLFLQGVNFLCVLGVSNAAVRLYFSKDSTEDSRRAVFGTATLLLLAFPPLVLLLIAGPTWWAVSTFLPEVGFYPYTVMILVMGLFTPLITLMSGLLTAQRRAGTYAVFHFGYFSIQSIAIVIAMAGLDLGLLGQVGAQLLTSVLFGAIAIGVLVAYAPLKWSGSLAVSLFSFGIPLVPFFVFSWLDIGAARFALENYADLKQLGLFSLASQFAGILTLVATSLDQALLPHFLKGATGSSASRELGQLVVRYLVLFGWLALGLFLASGPGLVLITTPDYYGALAYIGPLLAANLLYVARSPIVWSLTHSGNSATLSLINAGSTAVLVGMLILLVGHLHLGISGAVYSMAIANLCAIAAGQFWAQQRLRLQLPMGMLAVSSLALLAGALAIKLLMSSPLDTVRLCLQFGIFLVVSFAIYRLLGLRLPRRS